MAGAESKAREAVITIDGIAAGGAGVGRLPDGIAAFVHRTVPGERVRVRVRERRRRWARADLIELLEPSPARRDAPCPHYARCGGCTVEHLRYDAQLRAKGEIVREALRRIGGVALPEIEVVASPDEFRYRNRVSFTLRRLAGEAVVAGFHALDRPDRIVDIDEACLLPETSLAEAWAALRAGWGPGASRLPAGAELRLTLRASADGAVALLVEGGRGAGEPDRLLAEVDRLVAVWHRPVPGEPVALLGGRASLTERWDEFELQVGAAAFLQVNRGAARRLEDHVLDRVGDPAGRRIVDAYCGVGFHALRLAARGADVVGIELDAHAVEQGRALAAAGGLERARFVAGDVAAELPGALPADLLIVNPPRGGLDPEVTAGVLAAPPGRMIYVSCDPATLARDAARLAPVLRLERARAFDLFPQTSHVETVAEFAR